MNSLLTQYAWLLYALVAAMIWGLDYSFSEYILQHKISPVTLLLIEVLIGSFFLFFVQPFKQIKHDLLSFREHPKLLWMVLFVAFTFNVGNLLVFYSIRGKNATYATLIELSYPIFTMLFTWVIFNVHYLNVGIVIGSALIMCGVIVITLS